MPLIRRLFADSAFDSDMVRMMGEVFDTAWGMVAPAFNAQPQSTIDEARTILAKAILYRVGLGDQAYIVKDEAIRVLKSNYPTLPI